MRIAVIGTGYVGLVTGACFTEMGNHVVCVDIDEAKLDALREGIIPIYEPGLDNTVKSGVETGLLSFSSDLSAAISDAEYIFIAVGTPPGEDGSADLQYVLAVAAEIGQHLQNYAVIINKSTVPVGTADKVNKTVSEQLSIRDVDIDFDVVSNPEFLKEGAAVVDFLRPDRVVVGTDSDQAKKKMTALYGPYLRSSDRLMFMGIKDAEMTKYAANAMLATKISFMNEIAGLCDRVGVDVENVRKGIGSDSRIGYSFIYPGCGYGGSCFPKDVKALVHSSEQVDFTPSLLIAVEERNRQQKQLLFSNIHNYFDGDLKGKKIGIWGLAFKPGTDDMREAPSIVLINALIEAGADVLAFDPVAKETAKREFPAEWLQEGRLQMIDYQYDVLKQTDALVLVTEWKRFRQPDFEAVKELMKQPLIFDGRNQYDPKYLADCGFEYIGIGRRNC
ncbi:MAG: UDP-glucose/GDP-mannose dehydrogenase family protein [Pseudomonadales bacterium]